MNVLTYVLSAAQEVTQDAPSANAPRNPGWAELDVFMTVASDGSWSGITAVSAKAQASVDGENWFDIKDNVGNVVKLDFSADGSAYVTVDPVPGLYFRLLYDVTGSGDTLTITAKAVGRM